MNIRELAYTLYKIDWMRRISPERMSDFVLNYYVDRKIEPSSDATLLEVLEEFGFDGELYVCYDEFLENEYLDKAYMESLLPPVQYEEYLEDLKNFDKDDE